MEGQLHRLAVGQSGTTGRVRSCPPGTCMGGGSYFTPAQRGEDMVPTPGLWRFPQPLQAALILSVWLYFSHYMPRVFRAPPTNQQAQQCHVLSFASAGLAHLSVP